MRLRKVMVLLLAFWVIGALTPTIANASDFRLRIEDRLTGAGIVITDESFGDEAGGQLGVVSLQVAGLGGADTSLTMGLSKPVVFDPTALSFLFLNSLTLASSGAAHLILTLEDTGYTSVPTALQLTSHVFEGTFDAPATSSIRVQSFVNTSNVAPNFGTDTEIVRDEGGNPILDDFGQVQHIVTPLTPIPQPMAGISTGAQTYSASSPTFGSDSSALFTASGPYSLFTQVLIDLSGAGSLSFQQEARVDAAPGAIDNTPEPASLMLISMGVAGLASARRRFMANVA